LTIKRHLSTKISLLVAVFLLASMTFFARAQTAPPPYATLDETDLEQLVAPVALYPDPLLAQVLPAATYPTEIQSAAAWLQVNPNPPEQLIDAQPYDPPILAVLHYPDVLQQLNQNIDWTQQLGAAFLNQQPDVMNAVQQLRQRALSEGALVSGPQMQVASDPDGIEIYPTDPNVIYVPQYDPNALYIGDGSAPWGFSYSVGYPCGVWLGYNVDWHNHWVGQGRGWNHGWQRPRAGGGPIMHPWQRNNARPVPVYRPGARPGYEAPRPAGRPAPAAFDPNQNRAAAQRDENRARDDRAPAPQQRPAPEQRPAPQQRPAPAPAPRPAPAPEQRPAPAPAPRQAPAPAFHPDAGAGAASDRGHASEGGGARGGGGGGGARGGGGGGGGRR
jgi:uncharacterized membrane protein YgcG